MINNDWERFGDEIRRTIQNAVDSKDFRMLNQTVSDTVGRAMDNVSRGLKNGGWYREIRPEGRRISSPGAGTPQEAQLETVRPGTAAPPGMMLIRTGRGMRDRRMPGTDRRSKDRCI